MPRIQELDVRPIPPVSKHATIFQIFDSLKSGEGLQITNDHHPVPLFYQFQAQRPGLFDWKSVESGPVVWKALITRV